jgi:WD40 repeat protein
MEGGRVRERKRQNTDAHGPRHQTFFGRHSGEVTCLITDAAGVVAATGDVKCQIYVWSTSENVCSELAKLPSKGRHDKGIVALSFSRDAQYLVSVGADADHKMIVWHWRSYEVYILICVYILHVFNCMCACVCVYVCVYTHTYIQTCILYVCVCVYIYKYILYIHTCMYMYIYTCIYIIYIYIYIYCIFICMCMYVCMYACMYVCM